MNSYTLTKQWFSFCIERQETTTTHTALYLWLVERNNCTGWQASFPILFTEITTCLHIRSFKTFRKALDELVLWEFVKIIQKPENQFSFWEIALVKNAEANKSAVVVGSVKTTTAKPIASVVGSVIFAEAYNNSTKTENFYLKQKTFERGTHTHEENLKNSDSFFSENNSESVEALSQEKKKSCAQKRKELFEREAEFKEAVFSFAKTYPLQHLQAFYDYWSEPDPQQNMRFELERTWELSRRISQWMRREPQFTKPQTNTYHEEALDYSIPL